MARKVEVDNRRNLIQIFIGAPSGNVPVFNGFEIDIETATVLYERLGEKLKEVQNGK